MTSNSRVWVHFDLQNPFLAFPESRDTSTELYYITGGPARHERVSPKTWRRLRHFHDNWSEVSMVISTDQPRSEALNKVLHPPVLTKIFQSFQNLEVFGCFWVRKSFPRTLLVLLRGGKVPFCFVCWCNNSLTRKINYSFKVRFLKLFLLCRTLLVASQMTII
jgi:hypothetical protein